MSSSVTLSAATRQNLLSLQDTASLLSTTQNRLSTGKKVNSALDNPVNFFTSQGLNARSTALSSLLDGVSNGIQTIQAANTGITKLQGLTDQLKSVAQQALATSNAFTAKATSTSTALTGATADNLLAVGSTEADSDNAIGASSPTVGLQTGTVDVSTKTAIDTAFGASATAAFTIDGVTINLTKATDDTDQATLLAKINSQLAAGGSSTKVTVSGTNLVATSGATDGSKSVTLGGTDIAKFFGASPVNTAAVFSPTATSLATSLGFAANDTFSVNGQSVTVSATDTISSLAQKVGTATNGAVTANFDTTNRKFALTATDASTKIQLGDGNTTTSKVSNLGFTTKSFASGLGKPTSGVYTDSALKGKSVTVQAGSGNSVSLTFGAAAGQISSLSQLNAALAPANAQATLDSSTGKLTIQTANEAGADDLKISNTGTGNPFNAGTSSAIIGGDGLTSRNGLVTTYNSLLSQIDQLAADSGFNGVNLLTGDNLKINFNEKSTSSLSIQGSAVTASNLGLNGIGQTDFQETNSINKVISTINSAQTTLKNQASNLGSNLAVVQNRQDFTKQIINVLDTGSSNLTDADLNAEAANSQALSTRNSLGISALSLANQAQQGVLQLLR